MKRNTVVRQLCQQAGGRVLFVDDDSTRPELREDSFSFSLPDSFSLLVLEKPRTARELYRALVLNDRRVVQGGKILILPYSPPDNGSGENRFEATEIFLGVHREYVRQLLPGGIVELRKGKDGARAKRVISLAVFGEGGYWRYLGTYIRAHHSLFSSFELRVHHDESIDRVPYGKALYALADRGLIQLVSMITSCPCTGKCAKMLWRLAPAWDPNVSYVFSRDLDSLPTWRERCVVEEFISSGCGLHTIHDNVSHCGVMGGLCGVNVTSFREAIGAMTFREFIIAAGYTNARWDVHGADQDYLNGKIAPRMSILEHSVFKRTDENGNQIHRSPSTNTVRFITEVPNLGTLGVSEKVRQESDALVNYMGTAGYHLERALEFYESRDVCPVLDRIEQAESTAAVGPLGDPA